MAICRVCGKELVLPTGGSRSVLGIIMEYSFPPDKPEGGKYKKESITAREILRLELIRVGIDIDQCRLTSIWTHAPSVSDRDFSSNLAAAIRAVKQCRVILLLGALSVETFLGVKVGEIGGLRVTSDLLPLPIYATKSSSDLFHGTLGEFRFALEQMSKSKEIREYYGKKIIKLGR